MIQRKKRQVKIALLILIILAVAVVATMGIFKVLNKSENKPETQSTSQVDLKQYELKSIIVETKLTEEDLRGQYNASEIETLMEGEADETKLYLLTYKTEEETKNAYETLQKDENFQSVDLNKKVTTNERVEKIFEWNVGGENPLTSWGGIAMGMDKTLEAINNKTNNPEIIVAVIDSGLDTTHPVFDQDPTLKSRVLDGIDATGKDDVTDNDGHGTNVAGIILESTPDNVKVLPIKALDVTEEGQPATGTMADIISAINQAVSSGADIINMSLGANGINLVEQNAINKAYAKGIVCIAASGNGDDKTGIAYDLDAKGMDFYPAECENVITVGAVKTNLITAGTIEEGIDQYLIDNYQTYINTTTGDLSIAKFSNYGSKLDFVAPGVTIVGLTKGGKVGIYDGTSQAAPHIAAAAATIKSYNKDYTSDQIEEILEYYAVDLGAEGRDNLYGKGFVSFKEVEECTCGSDECDKIYCFGCKNKSCIYHEGKDNKLTSIAVTEAPTKTTYYLNEEFDPAGMVVTATYSDGKTKAVEGYTNTSIAEVWENLEQNILMYTIDIAYTEDKVTRHAKQEITLNKSELQIPKLTILEITAPPTKTAYAVGEKFDKTGMIVTATYDDESKQIVTNYTYTPTEELTSDVTEIVISYTEGGITQEVRQAITVGNQEQEKALSKIAITAPPRKTTYNVGEEFDKTGMVVTATYSDDSVETVTDYTVLPTRKLQAADTKVTVQYTKDGITKQADQPITVNSGNGGQTETKTLSKISVGTPPTKTSYIAGETFDTTGMIIKATYSDGSAEIITDYTYSPSGALKTTDTRIVVSYNGQTVNIPITVQSATNPGTTDPGSTEYPDLNSSMFNITVKDPNGSGGTKVNLGDGTTAKGDLAYTGLEDTILPIGICITIAVITVSYVSYRKYKDI